jgi:hypothetical protein
MHSRLFIYHSKLKEAALYTGGCGFFQSNLMKPSNSVIMAVFQDQYQGKTKTTTLHTGLLAEVAELVDALDSKSSDGNIMGVRFPPSAPK